MFVQDEVGIRMEVLCNGRVGDLLAELSGREVMELLGRHICSTISFSRRTLRREAGLVLKNVANLCRYTYLEGRYIPGGGRQIVGRPHSWIMYFTLKMFVSPTKCASPTINPWRRHCTEGPTNQARRSHRERGEPPSPSEPQRDGRTKPAGATERGMNRD